MNTEFDSDLLEDILTEDVTHTGAMSELVVYNDDFNTFEWVIECFMEVLSHSSEQAEQLSLIIHYTGKATVKTAAFTVLRPLKDALVDRGLSAVIETVAV
jgi:ATP-dependent Clp protease adaptor protein ClpS